MDHQVGIEGFGDWGSRAFSAEVRVSASLSKQLSCLRGTCIEILNDMACYVSGS